MRPRDNDIPLHAKMVQHILDASTAALRVATWMRLLVIFFFQCHFWIWHASKEDGRCLPPPIPAKLLDLHSYLTCNGCSMHGCVHLSLVGGGAYALSSTTSGASPSLLPVRRSLAPGLPPQRRKEHSGEVASCMHIASLGDIVGFIRL